MRTMLEKKLGRNDKGFTLIELLVVIIIIGILAAIAIPIFLNQRKKATEASMKSDARTVATQMETAFTDAQLYPDAIAHPDALTLEVSGETVKLSPNNIASVHRAVDRFCVAVSNPAVTGLVVYKSDAGGLQAGLAADLAAACEEATYGVNIVGAVGG